MNSEPRRKFVVTTDSKHNEPVAPNLLKPNAVAESFFHTLKTQLICHIRLNNFEEAERILFKYIEVYYNQRGKHSANGWKAPAHCEQEWYKLKNVA